MSDIVELTDDGIVVVLDTVVESVEVQESGTPQILEVSAVGPQGPPGIGQIAGDTGSDSITSSETLTVVGGTSGIQTAVTSNTLTITLAEVLEDIATLGANAADSEFLVGTGAGALAWESGATVRTSLDVYSVAQTDAAIAAAITLEDLDFAGDSGTGSVDLDSQTLTIATGNASIVTAAASQTLTISLATILEDLDTLGAATADNQFLVSTGAGVLAWESGATARTSLDVYSTSEVDALVTSHFTGTPADNQIAVFTDADTLEGDAGFTWDGSTLTLDAASLGNTAHINADNFVIQENSAAGLTIVSGATSFGSIHFADHLSATMYDGIIRYDHTNERMGITTATAERVYIHSTYLAPATNDGLPLGSPSLGWSDLYLASGAVINWANGSDQIVHSAGYLDLQATTGVYQTTPLSVSQTGSSGRFVLNATATPVGAYNLHTLEWYGADTSGNAHQYGGIYVYANNATDLSEEGWMVFQNSKAGTLGNRMIMSNAALYPAVDNDLSLGLTNNQWADIYLASGAQIIWNLSDVTLTHSANALAFAGGTVSFDANPNVAGADLVTASGTPADNQIAVFTDTNTVEGDANLTWDGTTLSLAGATYAVNLSGTQIQKVAPGATNNAQLLLTQTGYTNCYVRNVSTTGTLGLFMESTSVELGVSAFYPSTTDTVALGTSSLMWSDLFLASGGVINWNAGDVTLTHSSSTLTTTASTFAIGAGGSGFVTSGRGNIKWASTTQLGFNPTGVTADTAITFGETDVSVDKNWLPATNDGHSLGTTTASWSDLFLAAGGVVNWNNGAAKISESAGDLLLDAGSIYLRSAAGVNKAILAHSGTDILGTDDQRWCAARHVHRVVFRPVPRQWRGYQLECGRCDADAQQWTSDTQRSIPDWHVIRNDEHRS